MLSSTSNIFYNGLSITHICNPRLKNSYISIDKQANIVLKTPQVSSKFINTLLTDRESWIRKKIYHIESNPPIILTLDDIDSIQSQEYLTQKVEFFAKTMNLHYDELKFRKMKNRWGSCTNKGRITLNKKLIKTPEICIDYVVVHELAHLVHMNHSKEFHQLVFNYLPHAEEAKRTLSRIIFI